MHDSMETAITREKQLKKWNRAWKIRLIEERNLYWNDLYDEICRSPAFAGATSCFVASHSVEEQNSYGTICMTNSGGKRRQCAPAFAGATS
jgi:hypothetical protein